MNSRTTRSRLPRMFGLALAGMLAVASIAACSGSNEAHDMSSMPSAMSDMPSPMSSNMPAAPADAMFAQMMIPHHEQAVVMAELAETRASDPAIQDLAAAIKAAQQPEIDQMKAWLAEWSVPVMSGDEAMSAHGGHGMAGMLSDADLDALAATSGAEFDQLFAQYMILHHQGAIDMAQEVADSADPRVAELAAAIMSTQAAEISQLQSFLDQAAAEG